MYRAVEGDVKVFLVNDTSDDSNWGGRATSEALRELIAEVGGTVSSTLYQYAFSTPQAIDRSGQSECQRSGADEDVAPSHWDEFEACAQSVMKGEIFSELAMAIGQCDVVLINGEGCIYDRTRQSRMIFFIAYLSKRFFAKPTALVNHSIVMNDPVLADIARHVYPLLDDIVFREPDSARACPVDRGRVAADAAYLYEPESVESWTMTSHGADHAAYGKGATFDPSSPYACIGGGSVYFRGLRRDFDAVPGLIRLCQALLDSVGQVVLTASSDKDLRIMAPVATRLALPLADATLPIQQAVDLIGHAELYIGARWHPSIFAHRGGTPVIALSRHTPKMDAFLRQAGMPSSHLDPFSIEEQLDDIMKNVHRHTQAGKRGRESWRSGAVRLAETARENVRIVAEC
nr:polysaccharide pyruvyl transferase family protein [Halomonas organivorans]